MSKLPVVMTFAGHDPSGGAGLQADIEALTADRPAIYMVDSDRGITNLHVPSDVIIDASIPAIIRAGGKGWNAAGEMRAV